MAESVENMVDEEKQDAVGVVGMDPTLETFSLENQIFASLEADPPYLWQVETNSSVVASLASNQVVKLHDRETLAFLNSLQGHDDEITDISFDTRDESVLCTSSKDGIAIAWDTRTAKHISTYSGKDRQELYSVCSNNKMMVAGTETDILFWDVRTRKFLGMIEEIHVEEVNQVYFHPKSPTLLISGSEDGIINVYNMNTADPDDSLQRSMNCEEPVHRLGFFGPSCEFIYAVSKSDTLSLFNIQEAERISHFTDIKAQLSKSTTTDYLIDCCYQQDSESLFLCSGSNDGNMLVSRINTDGVQPCLQLNSGHSDVIRGIAWTDQIIYSVGEDARICQWKSKSKNKLQNTEMSHISEITKQATKREHHKFNPY